jgi:hypothetical protein
LPAVPGRLRRGPAAQPGRPGAGAAQWGWFRAHILWFYETLYREGNERVRRFLRPGGFVPFEVRWQAVMKELPCLNM